MTTLLQCRGVNHTVGRRPLLDSIDLTVSSGDRIGLVGHNGCGKSTLLRLLAGAAEPDAGQVVRGRDLRLAVVEQFMDPALADLTLLAAAADRLPADGQSFVAEQALANLGFGPAEFEFRVGDLSGGQQNRLMFVRAIVQDPSLILFDEPTNHLDLATLLTFERALMNLSAAYVLISHDRAFLDAVTNRTVFLRDRRLAHFDMPYSEARERLLAADAAAAATRREEERQIAAMRSSAKRLATWGKVYDNEKLARKAKSMEKRIERLEDEKTAVTAGSPLSLKLDAGAARARQVVGCEHLDVTAPDGEALFAVETCTIRTGDRVALLGPNGTGKSTFIRLLIGDTDGVDGLRINPQARIGYYDQELEQLDLDASLFDNVQRATGRRDAEVTHALIQAGFPYDEKDKPVATLSGGERARLMFLVIRLNEPTFLVMDEPTNHIDIDGREELEAELTDSNVTALVVSHDREFVARVATRYLLVLDGQLREYGEPDAAFAAARPPRLDLPDQGDTGPAVDAPDDTDTLLARILELEDKLAADLARKPRNQKPKLQAAWREELEHLSAQLDALD